MHATFQNIRPKTHKLVLLGHVHTAYRLIECVKPDLYKH